MRIGQYDKNKLILFGVSDMMKPFVWDNRFEEIVAISKINTPPPY